ncbi:hypothetical protein ACX1C1_17325 [Paenibacillus sp. strain BS8-2]
MMAMVTGKAVGTGKGILGKRTFDAEFEVFVEEQKKAASPRRLEMLERDLTGTIRLFKEILWPVFQTFDGFELEYELTTPSGVKIFVDVVYEPFEFAFECEGFSAHAEMITRERFSFEKSRVRALLLSNLVYVPFSWDEIEKKSLQCRSYMHELMLKYQTTSALKSSLTLYEREVLRCALSLSRPIRMLDMCECTGKKRDFVYKVIGSLIRKGLMSPSNLTPSRHCSYVVNRRAIEFIR